MVGYGRGCHLPLHNTVAECRESLGTHCVIHASRCYVTFKEGTVPCLQCQEGFLNEQESFQTLQKSTWEEH